MGRKALHTQDQVFEAADRLAASSREVTPTTLREALGGGSLTTIYRHLEAWEATRKAVPAPVSIPMPDAVRLAFNQAWQAAATEAGKEIAAIREKAETEIKATQRRLEEAVAAIGQLESEQLADADRLEMLEGTLLKERDIAHQAVMDAAAREAGLAATVAELKRHSGEVVNKLTISKQALEAELAEMRKEVRTLTEKLGKASGAADALRSQVAEQQATIRDLSGRR
ncbi:MAG: DNA-binding protein [Nitrosospira sp.]